MKYLCLFTLLLVLFSSCKRVNEGLTYGYEAHYLPDTACLIRSGNKKFPVQLTLFESGNAQLTNKEDSFFIFLESEITDHNGYLFTKYFEELGQFNSFRDENGDGFHDRIKVNGKTYVLDWNTENGLSVDIKPFVYSSENNEKAQSSHDRAGKYIGKTLGLDDLKNRYLECAREKGAFHDDCVKLNQAYCQAVANAAK